MKQKLDLIKEAKKDMMAAKLKEKWAPFKGNDRGGSGTFDNVLCGYIATTGIRLHKAYACHRPINSFLSAEVLWSCFGSRLEDDNISHFFFNWLCYKSPWSKTGVVPDLDKDFMFTNGFVFDNLDKTPGNLLHNFLIASRAAVEWPGYVLAWYELVTSHGINPDLAFFFLSCFSPVSDISFHSQATCFTKDTHSVVSKMNKYDWPLDTAIASNEYLDNWLKHKTVGLSKQFYFPTAHTSPVNILWGKEALSSDKLYRCHLEDTYLNDKFTVKTKVQTKTLSGSSVDNRVFTPESILEILKLEQKRLDL